MSPFLWGNMAQAIKAVAAANEVVLRSHAAIWKYRREVAAELGYPELFDALPEANSIHSNFYESGLSRDLVVGAGERIRQAVGTLLAILPLEVVEQ